MNSNYSEDVSEFLSLLSKHAVRYLIVGGEAVVYYGSPRLTADIDFFYEITQENVDKLYSALNEFWDNNIPGVENKNELLEKGTIFQFGVPPNRIDLINELEEINFQDAWGSKVDSKFSHRGKGITIHYIGLDELIKNKKAVGRHRDLEDLNFLNKISKKK